MATKGLQDFYVLFVVGGFLCMVSIIQVSDAASLSDLENRLVDLENQGRTQEKEIQQVLQELIQSKEQAQNYKEQLDDVVQTIKHHENLINIQNTQLAEQRKYIEKTNKELKLSKEQAKGFKEQLAYVLKTIPRQENVTSTQNTKLAEQQNYIEQTNKKLTWYKTQMKAQNSRIQNLEDTLNQPAILAEKESDIVQDEESDMLPGKGNQENEMNNTQAGKLALPGALVNRKQRRFVMAGAGSPVAFYATTDQITVEHVGINQRIVLDVVIINLGNGYHNQHGLFIAPVGGVYTFSVSIMTSHLFDRREVKVSIVKNGATLARAYAHADGGRHDQGAVTVITELKQGDEVWVSNIDITDDAYYGVRYTTFCGHLIY